MYPLAIVTAVIGALILSFRLIFDMISLICLASTEGGGGAGTDIGTAALAEDGDKVEFVVKTELGVGDGTVDVVAGVEA